MLGALLAILLLTGAVPVYAAEQTEMPDYFGIQSDAVKTTTGHTFTLSYGRPGEEVYDSFEVTDDFYYAIEPDGQITVTNTNPSDTGFVYMYCEVYYPKTSMTGYDGSTIQIPGGYFCDVDEDLYYLGENGQWISVWYGYWLLGAVTEDDRPGKLLDYGESCTFRLPDAGTDGAYLLHCFYFDSAITNTQPGEDAVYTEYQRNLYMYQDTADTVAGFTDVHESDYYADAVVWAKENGVTGGTSATTFSPAATVTRAEAVTFLWRAAGSPEPSSLISPYTDVTNRGSYYYKAVLWAAEQGITGGIGNNQFGPTVTLAYDQILTMLCRAMGESAAGSDWSAAAVSWASKNGLTDGLTFSAKANCPRSDVVYCLWKQLSDGTPIQPGGQDQTSQGPTEQEVYNTIVALKADYPEVVKKRDGEWFAYLSEFAGDRMLFCLFQSKDTADNKPCAVVAIPLKDVRKAEGALQDLIYSVPREGGEPMPPKFVPDYARYPRARWNRKYLLPRSTLLPQLTGITESSLYAYASLYKDTLLLAPDGRSLSAYVDALEEGSVLPPASIYGEGMRNLSQAYNLVMMVDMEEMLEQPEAYVRLVPNFFFRQHEFFRHFMLAIQFTCVEGVIYPNIVLLYNRKPTDEPME